MDWGLRSATSPVKPSSSHDIDYPVSSITTATAIRTRPTRQCMSAAIKVRWMQPMKAITRFLDETPRCSDELNEDRATPGTEGTTITPLVIDNAVVEVEPAFYQAQGRVRLDQTAPRTGRDLPFPGHTGIRRCATDSAERYLRVGRTA